MSIFDATFRDIFAQRSEMITPPLNFESGDVKVVNCIVVEALVLSEVEERIFTCR